MTDSDRRPRGLIGLLLAPIVGAVLALAAYLGGRPSARVLLVGAGALGGLLLIQQPGLGLVALAGLSFTLPITFGTGTEVALTPPVFLIPIVALAWLVDGLRRGSLRLPASRPVLPLLLFVLSGLISLLAGRAYWDPLVPQPGNLLLVQLGQWGIFALSALIFLVTGDLGSRGRWLEWAAWTFLTLAAVVVLEFFVPPLRSALGWSGGGMANRSLFWTWLGALAAGQLLFNRRLAFPARLGLLVLLAAAAYVVWFKLNDWVSGWAPFTLAVGVVVWLGMWRRNRAAGVAVVMLLVIVAAILYPLVFEHAGGEAELAISGGGRLTLYRAVVDLVSEHPLLGLGPAAYRHYGFTRWLSSGVGRALWIQPNLSSHNNYIDLYAQVGLVGLVLFLWFLGEVGALGWRLMPRFEGDFREAYVVGAFAGLAGTLASMMLADWFLPFVYNIGFSGFRTSALAWMFLGGLVALEQRFHTQAGYNLDGSKAN